MSHHTHTPSSFRHASSFPPFPFTPSANKLFRRTSLKLPLGPPVRYPARRSALFDYDCHQGRQAPAPLAPLASSIDCSIILSRISPLSSSSSSTPPSLSGTGPGSPYFVTHSLLFLSTLSAKFAKNGHWCSVPPPAPCACIRLGCIDHAAIDSAVSSAPHVPPVMP